VKRIVGTELMRIRSQTDGADASRVEPKKLSVIPNGVVESPMVNNERCLDFARHDKKSTTHGRKEGRDVSRVKFG